MIYVAMIIYYSPIVVATLLIIMFAKNNALLDWCQSMTKLVEDTSSNIKTTQESVLRHHQVNRSGA
jgi:hypothetical protein